MYYKFQESHIWTHGDPVDPNGQRVEIRAKSEIKARKKLPVNSTVGRVWVMVDDFVTPE